MTTQAEHVGLRLPPTTRVLVEAAANERGQTMSQWIRSAIRLTAVQELSAAADEGEGAT